MDKLTPEQHEFCKLCQDIHDEYDDSIYEAVELAFRHVSMRTANTAEDECTLWARLNREEERKTIRKHDNQIALRKIEEYKRLIEPQIGITEKCGEVIDDIIDWLQQEDS